MEIVEIEPDILNIDSFSIPDFKFNESFDNDDIVQNKPTSNFGGGIELLMNVKNKNDKKASSSIDIEDITNLESELNNLASNINDVDEIKEPEKPFYQDSDTKKEIKYGQSTTTKKSIFGDFFGSSKVDGENVKPVTKNVDSTDSDTNNLGKSTANMNETKTWDGYGKFNNIPINLEQAQQKPQLTKEEELREKFKYMRKLDDLEKKGISLSKRYTMDSNLDEMIGEYETIVAEKEKSNAIKFQGKMMMACITGLEFLNSKFDPFDIKLDGWGEQINENIDDYDDIFAELHEKYKSKAKMSPELKLLFQLGGSGIMVHMSNTLFKSSMPGMDDIMRQNPELMKQFTQAAVNTMGQTNPGFGGFMNGLFAGNNGASNNNNTNGYTPGFGSTMPPNVNSGPPPMSVETKLPERSQRMPNLANRPDINSARGIEITNNQANPYEQERITRPEMRGPSIATPQSQSQSQSISSLLNGLKAKQLDSNSNVNAINESSTISMDDFKDLTNARIPTKSKRRQKSDRNIVSLDI